MTFIVEDGSGVVSANAGISVAEFKAYHDARSNDYASLVSTDPDDIEDAIVKATSYIEKRFSHRFMGYKKYPFQEKAQTVLTFTEQPSADETVTLAGTVYTFKATAAVDGDVGIGARLSLTITSLINEINGVDENVTAVQGDGHSVIIKYMWEGPDGNGIAVSTTTSATFSFATLTGGSDPGRSQPLSFPRTSLLSREGYLVLGMPPEYKEALAEYAFRALSAELMQDPTDSATDGIITRKKEKVGPIEEETEYLAGATQLASYPAADRLLAPFLRPGGTTYR